MTDRLAEIVTDRLELLTAFVREIAAGECSCEYSFGELAGAELSDVCDACLAHAVLAGRIVVRDGRLAISSMPTQANTSKED